MIQLNKHLIERLLSELGILYQSKEVNKNWMPILCPYHNDNNFGNASIDINTGIISCFACNKTGSIIKLYSEKRNMLYKDVLSYLENNNLIIIPDNNYSSDNNVKKNNHIKKFY